MLRLLPVGLAQVWSEEQNPVGNEEDVNVGIVSGIENNGGRYKVRPLGREAMMVILHARVREQVHGDHRQVGSRVG